MWGMPKMLAWILSCLLYPAPLDVGFQPFAVQGIEIDLECEIWE